MRCLLFVLVSIVFTGPALADTYPVAGRFGLSAWQAKGPIDCAGRRIVTFAGNQRRDTGGGVPAFRNRSVTCTGPNRFAIIDEFTTGQIYDANAVYDLYIAGPDRILLDLQPGGALKLQRCK